MPRLSGLAALLVILASAAGDGSSAIDDASMARAGCAAAAGTAPVAAPRFVRTLAPGETGWFASPGLVDLNGDGRLEIVAPLYSTFVYDAKGTPPRQGHGDEGPGLRPRRRRRPRRRQAAGDRRRRQRGHRRGVRAPRRRACGWSPAGPRRRAAAASARRPEAWPRPTSTATAASRSSSRRRTPRRPGRRCSSSTRRARSTGRRVLRRPRGPASTRSPGKGNDADFNGVGNHGYGAYGENVGIGNLDDDPRTRDRRHIRQPPDQRLQPRRDVRARVSVVPEPAEPLQRAPARLGPVHSLAEPGGRGSPLPPARRGLGRTRARRCGCSGRPRRRRSPTSIGDGRNEVIGLPNAELKEPYETQAYAFMVLDGAQDGGVTLGAPAPRLRDAAPERQAGRATGRRLVPAERDPGPHGRRHRRRPAAGDRRVGARRRSSTRSAPTGKRLWRYDYAQGRGEDVRLGGRRRRPQPRRHARSSSSARTR